MRDCLGRWQELALVLNELTIANSRGVRLFVLDSLYHLVQVKGDRKLFSRITVGINNEEITFFILCPESSLI